MIYVAERNPFLFPVYFRQASLVHMGFPQKRALEKNAFYSGRDGEYVCPQCSSRVEVCRKIDWFECENVLWSFFIWFLQEETNSFIAGIAIAMQRVQAHSRVVASSCSIVPPFISHTTVHGERILFLSFHHWWLHFCALCITAPACLTFESLCRK